MDIIALTGETIDFNIDMYTTKAGKGALAVQVIINEGLAQNPELEEICKGIYRFSYKLAEAGALKIVILYNDMKVLHLLWICQVINFGKLSVSVLSESQRSH